jgi:hypothetical protein
LPKTIDDLREKEKEREKKRERERVREREREREREVPQRYFERVRWVGRRQEGHSFCSLQVTFRNVCATASSSSSNFFPEKSLP